MDEPTRDRTGKRRQEYRIPRRHQVLFVAGIAVLFLVGPALIVFTDGMAQMPNCTPHAIVTATLWTAVALMAPPIIRTERSRTQEDETNATTEDNEAENH